MEAERQKSMKIWLLDEGTPGHTVQTEGIGRILRERDGAGLFWIRCRLELAGWKRPLARLAVSRAAPGIGLSYVRKLYPGLELPENCAPDLVVSSCGKSAYLNRLLGRAFGARCVFIGERKPFPASWFDLIITPVEEGLPNELLIPVIETGWTAGDAAAAMKDHWRGDIPCGCWTLLIGGESRSHRFTQADWECLADGVNAISERNGVRWLISTSRRTGAAVESFLRHRIRPECIAEAVWWGEQPKKVVGAFLAAGERIFVTQDSLTMMSEALAVGKRTELLRPAVCDMPEESFNGAYVARLMAADLIGRIDLCDLARYIPSGSPKVSVEEMREEFRGKMLAWVRDGGAPK